MRSYSYDHANRLTQVTRGPLTTQFAYNGDGVRTRKTVGGHTTQYVLDLATTLPVVISDTDAVYLYGLDILAQQEAERLYYMHDGLGSVRQLVDTAGQIETNYAYDPFGVPVVAGDGSNPYQFTGEAWDAEVELLYLRARYYQPETGRLLILDPASGELQIPGSLNRYVYVTNNPINLVDPTGLNGEEPPEVAIWIRREMVRNAQSDTVSRILALNVSSESLPKNVGAWAKLSALVMFGEKVRQYGPWDPKPEIKQRSHPKYSQRIGDYWYYHDIWGNIMFGYLGTAAGFSEGELLHGAGLKQIGSDTGYCLWSLVDEDYSCTVPYPRFGWCAAPLLWTWDHPEDRVTAMIGIRLWKNPGLSVQAHHITTAVSNAGDAGQLTRHVEPWFGEKGPMTWQW